MHHPSIVGLTMAFQTKDKLFFVLDYCAGSTSPSYPLNTPITFLPSPHIQAHQSVNLFDL